MKRDLSAGKLLESLYHEIQQSEESCAEHCRREAERLPGTPPARALLALADHGRDALAELGALGPRLGLPSRSVGRAVGSFFSAFREAIADRITREERSYRGTLLGLRHGMDAVRLMSHAATSIEATDVMAFCDRWMARREALLADATEELRWFASHPTIALTNTLRARAAAAS